MQIAGYAYQVKPDVILAEFRRGRALQFLLLRYVQALMTQISQNAVCGQHHTLEQQLCRWLLLRLDRIGSREIPVTYGLIGEMLGVRRQGITQAASKLHAAGLIEYRRGHLSVRDRGRLQARACECYAVVRKEMDRLRAR